MHVCAAHALCMCTACTRASCVLPRGASPALLTKYSVLRTPYSVLLYYFHVLVHTTYYLLRAAYYLLLTAHYSGDYYVLLTAYCLLLTTQVLVTQVSFACITYYVLRTPYYFTTSMYFYILLTTSYVLLTTYCLLRTTYYLPPTEPPTDHPARARAAELKPSKASLSPDSSAPTASVTSS